MWPAIGKWLLFFTVVLLTLYPKIHLLPRTIERYLDPNALIDPEAPALLPLIAEFDTDRDIHWDEQMLAERIERFTLERVPYSYDWDTWTNVDYFPTVQEALIAGTEDCDGRAVVAASLLGHYGIKARLANDLTHVWVVTDNSESMKHGDEQAIVQGRDDGGIEIQWGSAIKQMVKASSWMISAFPLLRGLIILFVAWFLIASPLSGRKPLGTSVTLGLVMLVGLMFVRDGVKPSVLTTWVGWLLLLGGAGSLWLLKPQKSSGY